jgi:predicted CXXCH cytochrome family protein
MMSAARVLLAVAVAAAVLATTRRSGFDPAQAGIALQKEAPLVPGAPPSSGAHGYVTSNACRDCHAREYETWHASYHRTMTQLPSDASVLAPWQGTLTWQERSYVLTKRGHEFWLKLPDPDRVAAAFARGDRQTPGPDVAPDVERRVVLTTGSHHYQAYWVPGARGNELWQVPFVYHLATQRFLPRHEVFLQPPEDPPHAARWNSNCIQCHSVGGEPGHDLASDRFETRVAELGIACEACHGPGSEHVRLERDPPARDSGRAADGIVNPARLGAERASELCGQCHSYFVPREPERWWQSGFAGHYRPGDALEPTRRVLDYERDRADADAVLSVGLDSLFYTDGTIRVGGREWNGLSRSACFERGTEGRQASCLSCHRMHGGTRDDQLAHGGDSDAACATCHPSVVDAGSSHTHHAPQSSGSECVNCHMPHTTYALFKAIRSHRITRPLVDARQGAAPNACNLCHLDQSLAWTATWLARWYGIADPFRDSSQPDGRASLWPERAPHELALAASVLRGNAAERVVLADRLAWDAALAASGSGWQAPLLERALEDPYAAVRFVARRSLTTLANRAPSRRAAQSPPAPPLAADYTLDPAALERLRDTRDETPVRIAE